MTDTRYPTRAAGALLIATGVAALVLLASHPMEDARTFADVLRNEAAGRLNAAIVHGGFILVLTLQLIGYAVVSARLGLQRMSSVTALVFFAMGAVLLSLSMLLDGLVGPAVAARYVVKPDKIELARPLFVLIGSAVSFLMPIALTFQATAVAAWGWAFTATGSRIVGGIGLLLGGVLLLGLAASFVAMNPMVLMGAMAGLALWAIVVGAASFRGASTAVTDASALRLGARQAETS
jgi:hypothetical protein